MKGDKKDDKKEAPIKSAKEKQEREAQHKADAAATTFRCVCVCVLPALKRVGEAWVNHLPLM